MSMRAPQAAPDSGGPAFAKMRCMRKTSILSNALKEKYRLKMLHIIMHYIDRSRKYLAPSFYNYNIFTLEF